MAGFLETECRPKKFQYLQVAILVAGSLRHLNNKEIHCPIHQELCRVFDETIANHLGPNATDQDFLAEDLTPDYDFYDDDHDLDPDHSDLEMTPEMGDT